MLGECTVDPNLILHLHNHIYHGAVHFDHDDAPSWKNQSSIFLLRFRHGDDDVVARKLGLLDVGLCVPCNVGWLLFWEATMEGFVEP